MSLDKADIVDFVEVVAMEKGIPRDYLVTAIESAIEEISRRKYGLANKIKAKLDRKSGEIKIYRELTVVDGESQDAATQISIDDHRVQKEGLSLGEVFMDYLPMIEADRYEAAVARASINSAVRSAEKQKEYEHFIPRLGEIVVGPVKSTEYGHLIVDLSKSEAFLNKSQLLPNDRFQVGDLVKSCIVEVRRQDTGSQILLSRTNAQFMKKLFEEVVPEIKDGLVKIKDIVREPGSKAKISVFSSDVGVDPIACCIGIQGSRVKSVMSSLNGEKVDIVQWSDDLLKYASNALMLPGSAKISFSSNGEKIEVVVSGDQSRALVGRGGQNVKLASRMVGYHIEIMTIEQEAEKRTEEFYEMSKTLSDALELDETLAQFLVAKGYTSVQKLSSASIEAMAAIEGLDSDIADELIKRSKEYITTNQQKIINEINALGVEEDLLNFLHFLDHKVILDLANKGVKSLEDFVLLKPDEFKSICPRSISLRIDFAKLVRDAKSLL